MEEYREVATMPGTLQRESSLENSELFAGLPEDQLKHIASTAFTKSVPRGQAMFLMGDAIDRVLLLVDGWVKITQCSEDGREVILRLHGPGEVVGELAMWWGKNHSSAAHALQDCTVLAWSSAAFNEAMELFPELERNANQIVARRLAKLECTFREISTRTAVPRLAHGLVSLSEQMGGKMDASVETNLSQEELGQLTATSPFEVCRVLGMWERLGLVRVQRGALEIKNLSRLRGLARVS
jgi:CRP-like cAMP-binding protein